MSETISDEEYIELLKAREAENIWNKNKYIQF